MEGKTVVLSVLIMSLIMAKIQVEAKSFLQICCPNPSARDSFNTCFMDGQGALGPCVFITGCLLVPDSDPCPAGFTDDILEKSGGDAVDEYCKLGCVSSVCGTLQNSDHASEVVNGAVAECTKACSNICTKSSVNEVGTA